ARVAGLAQYAAGVGQARRIGKEGLCRKAARWRKAQRLQYRGASRNRTAPVFVARRKTGSGGAGPGLARERLGLKRGKSCLVSRRRTSAVAKGASRSSLERADDLDMRAPAELIDRRHAREREAMIDQHFNIAREGRRIARDISEPPDWRARYLFSLQT